ncbi:ribokinase [Opacimonas viscosa]|uniref:Ribokinase n=1 Tax=Opacimonas viscosa TaxID=2961944 RepID=A0AA41X239_9ALTE|nr:ribokinase [Opacimonas viscosa]MCP3428477.1 ribokinase [Opacimonas viscosa]
MAVINFGSINIDHVYQVPHFVQPGETLDSTSYQILLGGKGANQSIALANAGADVLHVGCINEHDVQFKQAMIKNGINGRFIRCTDTPSGHAIIQVTPSGENAIFLFGGANREIAEQDIQKALADSEATDWVLLQNETSGTAEVLRQAKAKGLKVAFNPAPMTEDIKSLKFTEIDVIIVNEVEAAELSEKTHMDDIEAFFRTHFAHGAVIITQGKKGAKWFTADATVEVPAFVVDAVDTTAAGDTFIGFFLAHYQAHNQAESALRYACAASALAVTQPGAAQSIPTAEQVSAFLAEQG